MVNSIGRLLPMLGSFYDLQAIDPGLMAQQKIKLNQQSRESLGTFMSGMTDRLSGLFGVLDKVGQESGIKIPEWFSGLRDMVNQAGQSSGLMSSPNNPMNMLQPLMAAASSGLK